jgi:hypothetical protein
MTKKGRWEWWWKLIQRKLATCAGMKVLVKS